MLWREHNTFNTFLRKAFYAFSRLLAIPIYDSFVCENCGPCPETVVCDGTMIGMRKDLVMPMNDLDESKLVPVKESLHSDRV